MLTKKNLLSIFFILILCLVPLIDFFHSGLPLTHDGQDHVARIANFYQNLSQGNIIPRWAANLNWGYGHPILMFLYPLPSYITSLFHFLAFNLVDSLKIVFILAFIASGFTMYLWTREFLGEEAALAASVLYTLAPYRFVEIYVRGDIGEHLAFVFPPLVCYFLYKISKKYSRRYVSGGALSLGLLILAHNAIALMFLPIICFYILYLLWTSSSKKYLILNTLYVILVGFCISAFFWMPGLFEGKYTLRNIVTKGVFVNGFSSFSQFLYGPWSFGGSGSFTVQVGIAQLIAVVLGLYAIFLLWKKKNRLYLLLLAFYLTFVVSLFLMTSSSTSVWKIFTLLQNFQFPWRFLAVSVFASSLIGALLIFSLPGKPRKIAVWLIILAAIVFTYKDWHANRFLYKPESFYTGIYYSTTDTGESAPIWSVRFMEHTPKAPMEVISGDASIVNLKRRIVLHEYEINALEKSRIRENTLYFPGWEVFVDGKLVPVEFQDPANRGLITFFVSSGRHNVKVEFTETKLRALADAISVFGFVVMIFFIFLDKIELWRRFRLY